MSAIAARAATCVRCTDHSSARIGDVDEMVHHRGPLDLRRLGRADVEPAVHLHRVERDDLDVAGRARDLERECRLARRGRTDEREVSGQTATTGIRTRRRRAGLTAFDEVAPQQVRRGARDPHRHQFARPSSRPRARSARACSGGSGPTTSSASVFDGPVDEHLLDRSDARCVLRQRRPLDHFDQALHALLNDLGRDEIVAHRRGLGAGTR